jgi:hypothetical protein
MNYRDFVIEASEHTLTRDPTTRAVQRSFKVRVADSPAGDMPPERAVTSACDQKALQALLGALENRQIDRDGFFNLGRLLGMMLLPPANDDTRTSVRELFNRSFDRVGADGGLRLRLKLPAELAALPWEYMYLDRTDGVEASMLGFLALDPRIAVVRHEAVPVPKVAPVVSGAICVLGVLASPPDLELLQLDVEERVLHDALDGQPGLTLRVCKDATLQDVESALTGAHVFHFAGHGAFEQRAGAQPGSVTGTGFLALDDQRVDAEQLGVNLRGKGVRVAVLGACESGRRAGVGEWGGVAVVLARAEVPAIIANQYSILDKSAIAFARKFYAALAGGLPLESAVQAGRIEAYNADKDGRDWGVPVLYLRAADGALFEGAADLAERAQVRQQAEANVRARVREVAAGGFLTGARVREFVSGKLNVNVVVDGTVFGDVVGLKLDSFRGGHADVSASADTVGPGGSFIGVQIDSVGGRGGGGSRGGHWGGRERSGRSDFTYGPGEGSEEDVFFENVRGAGAPPAAPSSTGRPPAPPAPAVVAPPRVESPTPPPQISTGVQVGTVSGGQVVGSQSNDYSTHKGIEGRTVQIGSVIFNSGGALAADPKRDEHYIEEALRLDVALPKAAAVAEPFNLVVQVKQPESPLLSVSDLEQVVSAPGRVFLTEESDLVRYRIQVTGSDFQVSPPEYIIKLRPKHDSYPVSFQVTPKRAGRRSLYVNAYQDDGSLAAQTTLVVEATVTVQPG